MASKKKTQQQDAPNSTPRAPRRKKVLDNETADAVQLQEQQQDGAQDAPEAPQAQDADGIDNSNSNDNSNTNQETVTNMATFQYRKTNTIGQAIYGVEGRPGVILIGKQLFAGEPPATLEIAIELPAVEEKAAKEKAPKLTPEERKALRDAMTPEQKLQEQEERLAKQAANLAARKAKLAQAAGAPAQM